ncbi:TonB C-terminal domain-containing protein, partial [Erythrobacter sp. SN021]|nr:TonB C-terminal domain-containing protein [Erythrobacter sp. SN021]
PQVQSPVPAPNSAADTRPRRRPDPPRTQSQPQSSQRSGGSRLGDNFLEGSGDSTRTNETRIPASRIGNSAKASLFQAVARQLRPHWQPPSGPEVEKIVTKVRFRLNPDGTLAGAPSVAGQRGVNATNRAQAGRHGEQAIRAVQLAAPFDLPDEYYEAWKLITVDFDWRLAQ